MLVDAYAHGIFPWFDSDSGPILWWSPDPRAVLAPGAMRISRRLARRLRSCTFQLTADRAFAAVVAGCAAPRRDQPGTWITPRMSAAYAQLHALGLAHSIEVWRDGALAGGLYGVSLGRLFFAESMFSRAADASKAALAALSAQLARWQFPLIDCQMMNPHLESLGAVAMPRQEFLGLVAANRRLETRRGRWLLDG